MFPSGVVFSAGIFDIDAMIGVNFSRRVDLWVSQGLGRLGMEVGSKVFQNTGVLLFCREVQIWIGEKEALRRSQGLEIS